MLGDNEEVTEDSHSTQRESNLRRKKKTTQYIQTANGRRKIMFQSIEHFPSAKHPPLISECLKLKLI